MYFLKKLSWVSLVYYVNLRLLVNLRYTKVSTLMDVRLEKVGNVSIRNIKRKNYGVGAEYIWNFVEP